LAAELVSDVCQVESLQVARGLDLARLVVADAERAGALSEPPPLVAEAVVGED